MLLLTFTGQVNLNHGLALRGRLGMSLNRRISECPIASQVNPPTSPASYPISPLRWRSAR